MYNPAGLYDSTIAVTTMVSQEGANLNIGVGSLGPRITLQQFVMQNLQTMIQAGMLLQILQISYDVASHTAFAMFSNPMTRGQSYQKANRRLNAYLDAIVCFFNRRHPTQPNLFDTADCGLIASSLKIVTLPAVAHFP
jgi:hypothetical protein